MLRTATDLKLVHNLHGYRINDGDTITPQVGNIDSLQVSFNCSTHLAACSIRIQVLGIGDSRHAGYRCHSHDRRCRSARLNTLRG